MSILRSIAIMVAFVIVLALVQTVDMAYPATPEGVVRYELVFDKNAMPLCENLDRDYEVSKTVQENSTLDYNKVQDFLQYVHGQATDCEKICFRIRKHTDLLIGNRLNHREINNPCKQLTKYAEMMMYADTSDITDQHITKLKDLQIMCYEREALAQHHQK